jgi:hypothetical protein
MTFYLIEAGIVAAFLVFCAVLLLADPAPPSCRTRVTARAWREFTAAHDLTSSPPDPGPVPAPDDPPCP